MRQELLSGVKSKTMFAELAEVLCSFPEVPLQQDDFEQAAAFFNQCRAKGVQGNPNDFLLCAVAYRVDEPILTTDKDFEHFAKALPIRLRRPATV